MRERERERVRKEENVEILLDSIRTRFYSEAEAMFELMLKQKKREKKLLSLKNDSLKMGEKKNIDRWIDFFFSIRYSRKKTLFVKISAFDPLESDYRKYSIGFAKTFLQKKLFNQSLPKPLTQKRS